MGRLVGRRLGAALLLVAVAFGVLLLSRLLSHKGLDWAARFSEVASFVIAGVGVLVAPLGRITEWLRGPRPLTVAEVADARTILQSALSAAWREEGTEVYLDLPMQVRFAPWDGLAVQLAPAEGIAPRKASAKQRLAGDFDTVVDSFSQKPQYRRVILGDAGAGKTALVTELQRRLLEAPGPRDPLPVIVPAASWRPDRQSALDWLADRLSADYAVLTAAQVRALVASGNVLPILDGLDEMPSALRPDALARINEHGVFRPLVLTSRAAEYRDAVHVCRAEVRSAVAISVEPMLPADIRAYLEPSSEGHWARLLAEIDADPGGALATVLSNPLMLWLTRVVYQDRNPDELGSFASGASIENHLLGGFVPAVYGSDLGRPTFRRFHCSVAQAEQWLGHLARDNYQRYRSSRPGRSGGERGASALAWWQLGSVAGRWRALGMLLRAAVLLSVAAFMVVWVLARHGNWRHGAYSGPVNIRALLLDGPFGRLIWPTIRRFVLPLPRSAIRQTQSDIAEFFHVIRDVLSRPYLLAAVGLVLLGLAVVRLFFVIPDVPRRLQFRVMPVLGRALTSYASIFVPGALVLWLLWLTTSTHKLVIASAFFSARSTWMSLGIVALLGLRWVPSSLARRSDTSGNLSPQESLRLDRQADMVVTGMKRSATAAAAWLFAGPQIAAAYAVYAITATLVAFVTGGVEGVASRTYTDARNWLAIRGRLPWRTMAFLADASRRGVLRQVGATYQFRHIRLLEQVDDWRSAPRPARLHEWKDRLSRGLKTLARGFNEFGPYALMGRKQLRLREEEDQKNLRETAARYWRMARTRADELPSEFAENLDELALELLPASDERGLASLRDLLGAYRALAENDPGTFKPRLANVLMTCSQAFPPGEAIRLDEEGVEVYRALAEADATTYLLEFAAAALLRTSHLTQVGRVDDAQDGASDLVDVCRRLASDDPVAALPVLAISLAHLADLLWESQPDDSLAFRNEVAAIYFGLIQAHPARYLSSLIFSLDTLASSFKSLGEQEEELAAIRAALHAHRAHEEQIIERNAAAVLRELVESEPTVFRLALRLWKLGEQQEALEPGQRFDPLAYPTTLARLMAAFGIADTRPVRLMTRRREERDLRRQRRRVRLWRGIVWLIEKDAWSPRAAQRLNSPQEKLAAALERLSDTADTLNFHRWIIGQQTNARTAAAEAARSQKEAVDVDRS